MTEPPNIRRRYLREPRFRPGTLPKLKTKVKKCLLKKETLVKVGPLIPLNRLPNDLGFQFLFLQQGITQRYNYLESQKECIRHLLFYKVSIDIDIKKYETKIKRLRFWIQKDQFVRTAMRRLVQIWLYKRYRNRYINTEDPATLSEPRLPIFVFDPKARGSYIFDAFSLRRSIQMNLTFTDWMFPEPAAPKNPLTNLPFTMPQVLRIIEQLRAVNATNWWIEAYYQLKFNLEYLKNIFDVPLKINSLTEIIKNRTSEEYIEYLQEFIEEQFDAHDIEFNSHLTILNWAAALLPNDRYMIKWGKIMFEFKKFRILYSIPQSDIENRLLDPLYSVTLRLFNMTDEIARLGYIRLTSISNTNEDSSQEITN